MQMGMRVGAWGKDVSLLNILKDFDIFVYYYVKMWNICLLVFIYKKNILDTNNYK